MTVFLHHVSFFDSSKQVAIIYFLLVENIFNRIVFGVFPILHRNINLLLRFLKYKHWSMSLNALKCTYNRYFVTYQNVFHSTANKTISIYFLLSTEFSRYPIHPLLHPHHHFSHHYLNILFYVVKYLVPNRMKCYNFGVS